MKKLLIKNILPHIIVLIGFYLFTCAYFPEDFSKKAILQSDITNFKGGSQETSYFSKKEGRQTLWTNSMFCGMPTYGISVSFPGNKTKLVYNILNPFQLKSQAKRLFFSLISFYFLMIVLGVHPLLAFVGSVGFGLSTYFYIIEAVGHNSKAYTMAFIPFVISGLILVYKKNKTLLGASIFALFFSLQNGFGHPQIVYYTGFIVLCMGLTYFYIAIRKRRVVDFLKKSAIILGIGIISLLSNFSHTYTNYKYAKETIRGKSDLTITSNGKINKSNKTSGLDRDYITAWSYGKLETFDLLIPKLVGGGSRESLDNKSNTYKFVSREYGQKAATQICASAPVYWGPQPFTEGPVYIGAVLIFLFFFAIIMLRGPTRIWIIASTTLCIILAWGKYFSLPTDLLIDYLPLYNKFRTVSMILVIAEFTIPFFAIYGLSRILKEKSKDQIIKGLKITLFSVGGICMFFIIFAGFFSCVGINDVALIKRYDSFGINGTELFQNIRLDRIDLLRSSAFRSLFFILLSALLIFIHTKYKWFKKYFLFLSFGIIIVIDLWPIAKEYLNSDNFKDIKIINNQFPIQNHDLQILSTEFKDIELKNRVVKAVEKDLEKLPRDEQYIRLLHELNLQTNYRVLNISRNVMTDASTSYLHKSLGGYSALKLRKYQNLWDFHISKRNPAIINMLNTKYIIDVDKKNKTNAIVNSATLGNVWFVNEYKAVATPDDEILALTNFEPARTAIINKKLVDRFANFTFTNNDSAKIELTHYDPDELTYKSSSKNDKFAVFSEIYYKDGWTAKIDGKESEILKVNYLLRGLIIPKGEHTIIFKFYPSSYYWGNTVSLVFSIILLLLVTFTISKEGYLYYKTTLKIEYNKK